MAISRRKFLGWVGAAGVGSTVAKSAHAAATDHFTGYPGNLGVLHDITRCVGCRSCEAACNKVNQLPAPAQPFTDLKVLEQKRTTANEAYTVMNRYEPAGTKAAARCSANSNATTALSRPAPRSVLSALLRKPKKARWCMTRRFAWLPLLHGSLSQGSVDLRQTHRPDSYGPGARPHSSGPLPESYLQRT